jgi:hypothetical protein
VNRTVGVAEIYALQNTSSCRQELLRHWRFPRRPPTALADAMRTPRTRKHTVSMRHRATHHQTMDDLKLPDSVAEQ